MKAPQYVKIIWVEVKVELTAGPQQYPECIGSAKMSLHFSMETAVYLPEKYSMR